MIERPMWCDTFDMDLPKVFPEARDVVGDLADVELWTTGHTTNGTLNHPDVWNGDHTMLAFFGFRNPARDMTFYVSRNSPVRCTVWEAFRDAWTHHYGMFVERELIWDTLPLTPQFDVLMYDARKWRVCTTAEIERARAGVLRSMRGAIRRLTNLSGRYAGSVRRLEAA